MKRFLRLLFIWREARMLFTPGRASKVRSSARLAILVTTTCAIWTPITACAQRLPTYLADRGTGIATSMFGEYVRSGELLVYPFYEFTSFNELEYKPADLGFGLDQDFRGKFRERGEFLSRLWTDRSYRAGAGERAFYHGDPAQESI